MRENYQQIGRMITLICLLLNAIYVFVMLCLTNGSILGEFGDHGSDTLFYEFFQGIQMADKNMEVNLPFEFTPIALIIFGAVGSVIPPEIRLLPIDEFRYTQQGNLICIFFIVCLFAFIALLFCNSKSNYTLAFLLLITFTEPIMSVFYKGGFELITIFYVLIFLKYNDSQNKYVKIISYVFLGIATMLKIYPIFFVLVIRNKKVQLLNLISPLCVLIIFSSLIGRMDMLYNYVERLIYQFQNPLKVIILIAIIFLIEMGIIHKKMSIIFSLNLLTIIIFGETMHEVLAYLLFTILFFTIENNILNFDKYWGIIILLISLALVMLGSNSLLATEIIGTVGLILVVFMAFVDIKRYKNGKFFK